MIESIALFAAGYATGYFWHSHVLPWIKRRRTRWQDDDRETW